MGLGTVLTHHSSSPPHPSSLSPSSPPLFSFPSRITCPIDVIKTRIQSNPKKYKTVGQTARTMIAEEGVMSLSTGLAPTVVGYGIEGAMKFGLYECSKAPLLALFPSHPAVAYVAASAVAGSAAALLLCPHEGVRLRQVTNPKKYSKLNLFEALREMKREIGIVAVLTAGLAPMLAKQVPYTAAKQVSFDVFAKVFYDAVTAYDSKLVSLPWVKTCISLAAACFAAVMASLFSQPGDVLLTLASARPSATFSELCREIHGRGGAMAFFEGTAARLLHVGGIISSQLVLYDVVKQALGLPATGKH